MSSTVFILLVLAVGGIVIHLVRLARANSATPEDTWARGFSTGGSDNLPVPVEQRNVSPRPNVPRYEVRVGVKHRKTFILRRIWSAAWVAIIGLAGGLLMAGAVALLIAGMAIWFQRTIG